MNTIELKNSIISKINSIDDESFLDEIQSILDGRKKKTIILSDLQLNSIEIGREQITKGNYIENEVLNNEMEQWLHKK